MLGYINPYGDGFLKNVCFLRHRQQNIYRAIISAVPFEFARNLANFGACNFMLPYE